MFIRKFDYARLAQMVERTALNRMVVGSSPTVGILRKHTAIKQKSNKKKCFLNAPLAQW